MKLYVHEKGILMVGKAWEIKIKLKEYSERYEYMKDWLGVTESPNHLK